MIFTYLKKLKQKLQWGKNSRVQFAQHTKEKNNKYTKTPPDKQTSLHKKSMESYQWNQYERSRGSNSKMF